MDIFNPDDDLPESAFDEASDKLDKIYAKYLNETLGVKIEDIGKPETREIIDKMLRRVKTMRSKYKICLHCKLRMEEIMIRDAVIHWQCPKCKRMKKMRITIK